MKTKHKKNLTWRYCISTCNSINVPICKNQGGKGETSSTPKKVWNKSGLQSNYSEVSWSTSGVRPEYNGVSVEYNGIRKPIV
jgi:hypothetical protein